MIQQHFNSPCGVLLARWSGERYSLPPAWRPLEAPQPLHVVGLREALNREHYNESGEVWIYPIGASNGPLVRPCREGNPEAIKRELGSDLFQSAIFVDLDDVDAHAQKTASDEAWFLSVETALTPFKSIAGWFYYRTQRGARAGIIHAPIDLEKGQLAKLELYAQIEEALSKAEISHAVEVDRACLDVSRGFAAPHINKRGQAIPTAHAQLFIHPHDLSLQMLERIADAYTQRRTPKSEGHPVGVSTRQPTGGTPSRGGKRRTVVPPQAQIDELDGSQQYRLLRSASYAISKIVHHDELRLDIMRALDRHISGGRRAQKEPSWFDRTLTEINEKIERSEEARADDAPPEPANLSEFPELKALRRVYERSDDVELADAVLESFGESPLPLWHGEGLRRYDTKSGTWKMYGHHALRRIAFQAAGAQTTEGRDVAISNSKVKGALDVLASKAGADQESPFDAAPAGVMIGDHFVSYSLVDGLKVSPPAPEHMAIHRLDYDISPETLTFWQTDGDEGRAPARPRIFCDTFLTNSLRRTPEEDETPQMIEREVNAKILTIGEWIGLALLGACTMEATALVVHGKGSNGKSVLTSLITDLFGVERTAHLPPQAMKERFSRAQLFGAAVNVVSEMPESDLLASDTLKAVISGDRIEVERKHRDPFTFRPRAAHVFAANNLPSSRDRSHGLWRRLVPIEFHHIFTDADKDRGLLDKLRDEYDLLLPWALNCARDYFIRGGYAHKTMIDKWRMNWRSEVDAVASFAHEKLTEHPNTQGGDAIREIWNAFLEWCVDNGQHGSAKMSLKAFSRQICALPDVERGRHGKERETRINRTLKQAALMSPKAWGTA